MRLIGICFFARLIVLSAARVIPLIQRTSSQNPGPRDIARKGYIRQILRLAQPIDRYLVFCVPLWTQRGAGEGESVLGLTKPGVILAGEGRNRSEEHTV